MNDNKDIVYEIDNIIYTLHDNFSATVIGNTLCRVVDLDIPGRITYNQVEYIVEEIGQQAFKQCKYIDYTILPSSIKKVFSEAFMESTITYLDFTQIVELHKVQIFEKICSDCVRLKGVRLAAGIFELPDRGFYNCVRLEEINTPSGLIKIKSNCFYNCKNLKHFDFTNDIAEIDDKAFYMTSINYSEIGYRVEKLGSEVFGANDNLSTLVIFNKKIIPPADFIPNTHRVTVYIKEKKESDRAKQIMAQLSNNHFYVVDDFNLLEKRGIKFLSFELDVARAVGYNESNLDPNTKIVETIGGSPVTDFQSGFLKYSQKITSCTFPKSIKRIKGRCFEGCKNLKQITFRHDISQQEANWVVSEENVEIVIAAHE